MCLQDGELQGVGAGGREKQDWMPWDPGGRARKPGFYFKSEGGLPMDLGVTVSSEEKLPSFCSTLQRSLLRLETVGCEFRGTPAGL